MKGQLLTCTKCKEKTVTLKMLIKDKSKDVFCSKCYKEKEMKK